MKILLIAALMGTSTVAAAAGQARMDGPAPGAFAGRDLPGHGGFRRGYGPMGQGGGHRSPERMFERIDANHDGSISRAEFIEARQRMMERRAAFRAQREESPTFPRVR